MFQVFRRPVAPQGAAFEVSSRLGSSPLEGHRSPWVHIAMALRGPGAPWHRASSIGGPAWHRQVDAGAVAGPAAPAAPPYSATRVAAALVGAGVVLGCRQRGRRERRPAPRRWRRSLPSQKRMRAAEVVGDTDRHRSVGWRWPLLAIATYSSFRLAFVRFLAAGAEPVRGLPLFPLATATQVAVLALLAMLTRPGKGSEGASPFGSLAAVAASEAASHMMLSRLSTAVADSGLRGALALPGAAAMSTLVLSRLLLRRHYGPLIWMCAGLASLLGGASAVGGAGHATLSALRPALANAALFSFASSSAMLSKEMAVRSGPRGRRIAAVAGAAALGELLASASAGALGEVGLLDAPGLVTYVALACSARLALMWALWSSSSVVVQLSNLAFVPIQVAVFFPSLMSARLALALLGSLLGAAAALAVSIHSRSLDYYDFEPGGDMPATSRFGETRPTATAATLRTPEPKDGGEAQDEVDVGDEALSAWVGEGAADAEAASSIVAGQTGGAPGAAEGAAGPSVQTGAVSDAAAIEDSSLQAARAPDRGGRPDEGPLGASTRSAAGASDSGAGPSRPRAADRGGGIGAEDLAPQSPGASEASAGSVASLREAAGPEAASPRTAATKDVAQAGSMARRLRRRRREAKEAKEASAVVVARGVAIEPVFVKPLLGAAALGLACMADAAALMLAIIML